MIICVHCSNINGQSYIIIFVSTDQIPVDLYDTISAVTIRPKCLSLAAAAHGNGMEEVGYPRECLKKTSQRI
jgi:hypothetical protein